jgi:hypothetical protein
MLSGGITFILNRFWIDDWIYWTLWYSSWLQFTVNNSNSNSVTHTHTSATVTSSLSLLGSGFQRRTFLSSGFPNCPRPQLLAFHNNSSQRLNSSSALTLLTHQPTQLVLLIIYQHGPYRKHRSSVAIYSPLPSNGHCIAVYFAVVASNWSTRHNQMHITDIQLDIVCLQTMIRPFVNLVVYFRSPS